MVTALDIHGGTHHFHQASAGVTTDAVFNLEALTYDPNRVEYSSDTVLQTERNDRVSVTFEGLAAGKRITLRVLELEGRTDFDRVLVSVSPGNGSESAVVGPNQPVSFDFTEWGKSIAIRLYAR